MKASIKKELKELVAALESARDRLSEIAAEWQGEYDNHVDRWYETEKAEQMEEDINALQSQSEGIDDAIDAINETIYR